MFLLGAGFLMHAGTALAHLDIRPLESPPEIWQIYSLVVPTESDSPTTWIEMRVPAEFEIEAIHHEPEWQLATSRNEKGRVTTMRWSGSSIPPLTFKEFKFFAKNPAQPGVYKWVATQRYENGRSSTWTAQSRVTQPKQGGAAAANGSAVEQATTLSYLALALAFVMILVVLATITRRERG